MTAAQKWAAAGASATILAGGLLLGAPVAVAAPGDAACTEATAQFETALSETGVAAGAVTALEQSAGALAALEAQYAAVVEAAGGPSLQELEAAGLALVRAQQSGDPAAVAAAEARVLELESALTAALGGLDPAVAEQAALEAAAAFEEILAGLSIDQATAERLLLLLQQAAAACQGAVGTPVAAPVTPVVPAPAAPAEPVGAPAPAPVQVPVPAPVQAPAAPVAAAPVAVNSGVNLQTAAESEERPLAVLLAVPLVVGAAASAVALRRVRRHRPRH